MAEKQNPHVRFVKYADNEANVVPFVSSMPQNQLSLSVLPNESTVTKQKTDDLVFMRRELIIPCLLYTSDAADE